MSDPDHVVVVEERCACCKRVFHICEADYRGQRYCSDVCREYGDTLRKRRARAWHQSSEEGRADHRDRQRAYRERRRSGRVTDQGSEELARRMESSSADPRQTDLFTEEGVTDVDADAQARPDVVKPLRCVVCGVQGTHTRRPPPAFLTWLARILSRARARGPP